MISNRKFRKYYYRTFLITFHEEEEGLLQKPFGLMITRHWSVKNPKINIGGGGGGGGNFPTLFLKVVRAKTYSYEFP